METFFNEELYLEDLKSKFKKIKPNEYYLAYSGGKDSHFIYWFLRIYLKENDIEMYNEYKDIKIVGVNTFMEHKEILHRIRNNCDVVLKPALKPFEIKERYGIPCFNKSADEKIRRYQNGLRSPKSLKYIYGTEKSSFNINAKARELLLDDKLHNVSPYCCKYLKKLPMINYGKENNRKAIIGITKNEGKQREAKYTSCFTKNGNFTPLWDLTSELEDLIIKKYDIEIPKVYNYISRTGCMGCPYGSFKGNTERELLLVSENQYKFLWKYFEESYKVLGIKRMSEEERKKKKQQLEYEQLDIFDFIE